jgi:hypothetical protein
MHNQGFSIQILINKRCLLQFKNTMEKTLDWLIYFNLQSFSFNAVRFMSNFSPIKSNQLPQFG